MEWMDAVGKAVEYIEDHITENIKIKGGYTMDYKIIKKESFTVLGVSKEFTYENAKKEIPEFWKQHYALSNGKYVCGMYGVNIDPQMGNGEFEYLIADD